MCFELYVILCFRKSLDLVETLLRLSAQGHYQQCMDLFKFPLQHCPDMLVLAMLQIVSILSSDEF
jgi:hypothetical protein